MLIKMTTQEPQKFNLQVQVSNGVRITSFKAFKGERVAFALIPDDDS